MIGVCIVTYNQEQYIAQAIESVLMQADCGHKVVVYVGEDNSTDKTGAICDEIANRVNDGMSRAEALNEPLSLNDGGRFAIKVIHNKKNLGLVGNTMNLLDIMRKDGCEYIAMLDGDDYWCDDHKLQKQMAYMEAHPEYGLVHTLGDTLWGDRLVVDERTNVQTGNVTAVVFGHNYQIGNNTVVFKTELLNHIDFDDFQKQGFLSCDYIMYIIFSCYTQFGFLYEHTAVWRRGHDSVSNANDMEKQMRYVQNAIAMWCYAAKLFPDRWKADENDVNDFLHYRAFTIAFKFGDRKRALQEAKLMSKEERNKHRFKIIVAHSALLSWIWRKYKERNV